MESLNLLTALAHVNVEQGFFYVLAAIAIPLAYGVVFDRNVIRSGFLLIGVFATIAGLFFLLQAQFLGLSQILIYGVGITLVIVIALMLTNARQETGMNPALPANVGLASFVSVLVFTTIYLSLRSAEDWPLKNESSLSLPPNIEMIGKHLMTYYALPFEFASILLLAALVGAVMLSKAEPASLANAGDEAEQAVDGTDRV